MYPPVDMQPLYVFLATMLLLSVVMTLWAGRDWWRHRGDELVCNALLYLAAIAVSQFLVTLASGHPATAMVVR